jgi:hypothetical protein
MPFVWGIQDSSVATHSYSILGNEFVNYKEAFSIFNLVLSFGVLVF